MSVPLPLTHIFAAVSLGKSVPVGFKQHLSTKSQNLVDPPPAAAVLKGFTKHHQGQRFPAVNTLFSGLATSSGLQHCRRWSHHKKSLPWALAPGDQRINQTAGCKSRRDLAKAVTQPRTSPLRRFSGSIKLHQRQL
jgi:hypothetical protein